MFQNSAEIMSQNIRAGSEDYFELYSNSVFDMLSYFFITDSTNYSWIPYKAKAAFY